VGILVPARRDVAARGRPQVGVRLPFVNYWNAYCLEFDGIGVEQRGNSRGTMKIYLLMALISAIAALSHLKLKPKGPEREA
jgi:hypothetical protein